MQGPFPGGCDPRLPESFAESANDSSRRISRELQQDESFVNVATSAQSEN